MAVMGVASACSGTSTEDPVAGPPEMVAVPDDRPDPSRCRPHGVSDHVTAGFPLPPEVLRASGTLRVAVLFVDFPDATAPYAAEEEAEMGLPFMEEALESSSYGGLDIEFVPLYRWLRAEHSHVRYLEGSSGNEVLSGYIDAEAVRLADPHFDFEGIDSLMVVMPSTHLLGGTARGGVETDEGPVLHTLRVNAFPQDWTEGPFPWGWVATHEFLHLLGLVDMYPFGPVELHAPPDGETWIYGAFGFMSLLSYYLAPTSDIPPVAVVQESDGSRSTESLLGSTASEMLAWSRWQLGWLSDDQVLCIRENRANFDLTPLAEPGNGTAMAAIPLSRHEVIVLESRRPTGFDLPYEEPRPGGGRIVQPALLHEGVLVYRVDASISTGDMPIRLLDDAGDLVVSGYPVLGLGESVTLNGYTITVVADDGDTHTVDIARTGDGSRCARKPPAARAAPCRPSQEPQPESAAATSRRARRQLLRR